MRRDDHPEPSAGLEQVLITEDLARRPPRPPDHEAEARALAALAEAMAASPETILQKLVDTALELCRAGSAGISILEAGGGTEVFRWHAIAGHFAHNLGGTMPRAQSPCGLVIERDAPQLFAYPERHYRFPVEVKPPLAETLLVPFHAGGRPVGTVWAVAHTPQCQFDAEDARLLTSLSRFASAARQMTAALQAAVDRAELERRVEERTRELRASEERLRRMLNIGVVGVLMFDESGTLLDANDAFLEMSGFSRDEVAARGLTWRLLTPPEYVAESERQLRVLAATGRIGPYEKEYFRKDGSRSWMLFAGASLGDGTVVEYCIDVSDRKRAEAALRESEERFRLMVQTVQDYAIFLMDPDGNVVSWNEGAQRLLGYAAGEVLGRPGALFFAAEDRRGGLFEHELWTAAETGRARDENWQVRKDGSRFWASGTTTALRDAAGGLRGFAKIFRDLTERKAAEDALREKDLRLRAALAAGRMGTWHWDIAADRQNLDESLSRLLGLPPEHTAGTLHEFLQVVHAGDREAVAAAFRRSVERGDSLNVEFRVLRPAGGIRWLKDQGDVVRDADGRPLYLTGACVDITDRKALEEELREAGRRKDEFLAMLGHELRNPLAPLRGVMETLQRQQLDGAGLGRAYAMMDRQIEHLSRLVDDLLDVSRITRGLVELRRQPVDLAAAAVQAVEMVTPAVEGRGHDLNVALPRRPLRVEGDATRLTQVVFNLLNNAAKYTNPGGKIWLTVEREGEEAVVRVRDNGAGMQADLVPKVFDLFTQGERTPDRSQGGLGLGLALVKRLVEMHGGTVAAHSAGPGKGSEFVVRLPALPAAVEAPPQPAAPAGPPPAAVQADRVLVVDDSFDVAESLTWMLEGLAREVKMVHSGAAAVETAGRWRPDVILCDLGMPEMDGYETCRRLRQMPGLEKTLIAAVSGYGGEEQRRQSRAAGFDRHLVKPIGRATLEELIRAVAGA
jgi:PAS domain S-box-containing protein